MPNQSGKIVLVLVLIFLILGAAIYFFIPILKKHKSAEQVPSSSGETNRPSSLLKSYSSKDSKISFEYPEGWIIDNRYNEVLIANFKTSLNSNKVPGLGEVEIIIHNARGCHKTIDENLIDPSCGELGQNVKTYVILSKATEEANGAKFYKYLVKSPDGKEQKFYFLEKRDRVLQIDKKPDLSMFEKEFDEIVKSIKFLEK